MSSPIQVLNRRKTIRLCLLFAMSLGTCAAQTASTKATQIRAHLQKAQAALKANDSETAAQEFRAILVIDPRSAEACLNLGVIELSEGDARVASGHLRKALAIQPSLTRAQALLGISEKRLGKSDAQHLLETSFAKLTDAKLRTQVGKELIGLCYQQGDTDRAVPILQKLVDLNPDDVDILYMAQRLYKELADGTLDKLAVLAPGSARMQQVVAERLINAGDAAGAIDHFKRTLDIDPRISGVRFELAQAILESAKSNPEAQAEAEKELESAIRLEGDSASLQCALGAIALLNSDSEKAHARYTRAFSMDPRSTQAQLGLGQVLMTMEKPEEARKYLEMAVKSDPLNGTAHYRLASAYKRLQMADAAQKEMHLFQEIKDTKDQVRQIYRQMKSQYHAESGEVSDSEE